MKKKEERMHPIDIVIVVIYLLMITAVGLAVAWRQKQKDQASRHNGSTIDSFFLGSRNIPWWALAASGMASNLDVSGTMINTAFIYAMGVSGFYIELRGGVTLALAFLLAFMGKWTRRSEVMTAADWMSFRFGDKLEGSIARITSAVVAIVFTIGNITYFAVGTGKFAAQFLGIPDFLGVQGEFWASVLITALALLYTVTSGLHGVVWTDVIQGFVIFVAIVYMCIKCWVQVGSLPDSFKVSAPLRDGSGFEAYTVSWDRWSSVVPPWSMHFSHESQYAIYNIFFIAIASYFVKISIEGFSGPGGYMAQRYFACASDKDAGVMSALWIFLLSFRWPFIAATAILGVYYGVTHENQVIADPERVLPSVVDNMLPVGVKGLVVAAMISAAMSTFDSTVNSGASFWVKDIYQAYINKNASQRVLMAHSRVSSVLLVVLGMLLALVVRDINQIWGWITVGIGAGLTAPTLLRWYWWRVSGYSFGMSTLAGTIAAVAQNIAFPNIPEYFAFATSCSIGTLVLIISSLLIRPTPTDVLLNFYCKTRPFGLWGPIKALLKDTTTKEIDKENTMDILSVILAVPWQITLFLCWMALVMTTWISFAVLAAVVVVLTTLLYFVWYRRLGKTVKVEFANSQAEEMMQQQQQKLSDGIDIEANANANSNDAAAELELPTQIIINEEADQLEKALTDKLESIITNNNSSSINKNQQQQQQRRSPAPQTTPIQGFATATATATAAGGDDAAAQRRQEQEQQQQGLEGSDDSTLTIAAHHHMNDGEDDENGLVPLRGGELNSSE